MKLFVVSDLHTEFAEFEPQADGADVAVLAGDIGVGLSALEWIHQKFSEMPVVYVLGNHEFYRGNLDDIARFKAQAAPNVHILEQDAVILNGVRFLGTTLWTDFALFGASDRKLSTMVALQRMADFRVIGKGENTFTPDDAIAVHEESVQWLAGHLAQPHEGNTVVVTHHAPSWLSVAERFKTDLLTPAFASRLEPLIEANGPNLWIHGHTHDGFDYQIANTRVFCNPRGYPGENNEPAFNEDALIELGS